MGKAKVNIPWCWSFWSRGDADHVGVPDGHHAKGDVLAAGVVCTANLSIQICIDEHSNMDSVFN